jgi:hypothetical protein
MTAGFDRQDFTPIGRSQLNLSDDAAPVAGPGAPGPEVFDLAD